MDPIIILYVLIAAAIASTPMLLDIILAYRRSKQTGEEPKGIPGLARATMALTVIVILAIAVFHLLVVGGSQDIINNVLSMLAGLLAAITGFYFGGKTTEKKPEEKEPKEAQKVGK